MRDPIPSIDFQIGMIVQIVCWFYVLENSIYRTEVYKTRWRNILELKWTHLQGYHFCGSVSKTITMGFAHLLTIKVYVLELKVL